MSVREQSLQIWPHQIEKVKQLYNQIMVRHGVMLVGPTGGGKTAVRTILQKALILLPTITAQDDSKQEEGGKSKAVYVVSLQTLRLGTLGQKSILFLHKNIFFIRIILVK